MCDKVSEETAEEGRRRQALMIEERVRQLGVDAGVEQPVRIEIRFTVEEYERLKALAEARGPGWTPERCVREFARTCQPGGGGWVSPADKARARERTERTEGGGE